VYIYKKAERLAKAIHLITPAFVNSPALRDRLDTVAIGLIDGAITKPSSARETLSRELLALSSLLSVARTTGLLSAMNTELIGREAHLLLQEVAMYEEPRIFLDEAPTLATLSKDLVVQQRESTSSKETLSPQSVPLIKEKRHTIRRLETVGNKVHSQGQSNAIKDTRKEAIREILKVKGPSYIKDISTIIRNVSEKTIQRELQGLVEAGEVQRSGERRWTMYTLA
jgi:hypothetical protein